MVKHDPNCKKEQFWYNMQSQRKTGGGPAAKPLATTTEKIISLLSDEPSFLGIQGGFESGVSCDSGKFTVILSISVYFPDKLNNSCVYWCVQRLI